MKLMLALIMLALTGCDKHHINIVHDYVIREAQKQCSTHKGLHYIVSETTLKDVKCRNSYYFHCEDGVYFYFNDGIDFCDIQEIQIEETLHYFDKELKC